MAVKLIHIWTGMLVLGLGLALRTIYAGLGLMALALALGLMALALLPKGLGLNFKAKARPNPMQCFIITLINADEFDPDLFPLCILHEPFLIFTAETSLAKCFQCASVLGSI